MDSEKSFEIKNNSLLDYLLDNFLKINSLIIIGHYYYAKYSSFF